MAESGGERLLSRRGFMLACAATFVWHLLTLHPGHNWGGDFAQYIMHARNILAGRGYAEGIMLDNPVLFPPGFPVLLAPLIRVFGVNFQFLKIWNVVFWYGMLVFLYDKFRRNFGETIARLSVLFFVVNAYFFYFKQNVLSDIPFAFFVWASLTAASFYEKQREQGRQRKASAALTLAVVLTLAAFCIRAAGVALAGAMFYYFAVIRRNFRAAGILGTAFLSLTVVLAVTIGSSPGDLQILLEHPAAAARAVLANVPLITRGLWIVSFPIDTRIMRALYQGMAPLLDGAAGVFYIGLCVFFAVKSFAKTLTFEETFLAFYCGMLLVLSAFDNAPQEFIRFLFPVWGVLLFVVIRTALEAGAGMSWRRPVGEAFLRVMKAGFVVMILVNAGTLAITHRRQDDVLYRKANQELFSWVKENIPPDGHYIFWQPRTLALMTGRVGTDRWNQPSQRGHLTERIAGMNIRFLLLDRGIDADLLSALEAGFLPFDEIWQNSQYRVFRMKR